MSGLNIRLADLQISDFHAPECCFLWWHTEKTFSFWGRCPQTPTRGFAPGPHWGPTAAPRPPHHFPPFSLFPSPMSVWAAGLGGFLFLFFVGFFFFFFFFFCLRMPSSKGDALFSLSLSLSLSLLYLRPLAPVQSLPAPQSFSLHHIACKYHRHGLCLGRAWQRAPDCVISLPSTRSGLSTAVLSRVSSVTATAVSSCVQSSVTAFSSSASGMQSCMAALPLPVVQGHACFSSGAGVKGTNTIWERAAASSPRSLV